MYKKLSTEDCRKAFRYEDGALYWNIAVKGRKVGDTAGSISSNGRLEITYKGTRYWVHRIIFLMHYNFCPQMVDHKDGNPLNNRIENLRAATASENTCNSKRQGHRNIRYWKGTYEVRVQKDGVSHFIGCYKNIPLAQQAAVEARKRLHGEFASYYNK